MPGKPHDWEKWIMKLEESQKNPGLPQEMESSTRSRQPVHTVYGGAHLFKADTILKLKNISLKSFQTYAPTPSDLAEIFSLKDDLARRLHPRILKKLQTEAVEDFRLDFEDGFGPRPSEEEDRVAQESARQVALALKNQALPPFIGIRIKSLGASTLRRGTRTLELFLTTLLEETQGTLPENFTINLPKVEHAGQVATLNRLLESFEKENHLPPLSLKMEIMVETPSSLFRREGTLALPFLLEAAGGRCRGFHLGAYDFTTSCEVPPPFQTLDHPYCDMVRFLLKTSLGNLNIPLSDGVTNILPVGENRETILRVWKKNFSDIRHSLKMGYFQGWDLHPAQFPVRYAALYSFFLEHLEEISGRLQNFTAQKNQATLSGTVFDDAATGRNLLQFFHRAYHCGALEREEIPLLPEISSKR